MTRTNLNNVRIVYFGHNRKDIAFIRRIESFLDIGCNICSFTFRRDGTPESPGPAWRNLDLGHVAHAHLFSRIKVLLTAVGKIFRYKKYFHSADIIYARNLDMALLAWLSIILFGNNSSRLVYECLDVHESLTKSNLFAKLLRFLERRLLNKTKLLVVSSPGFVQHYFTPIQNYNKPFYLLENKLYFHKHTVSRPTTFKNEITNDDPIIIVWAGILRCQETLDVLKKLANSTGNKLHIRLHGIISYFLIPDFMQQIKGIPNIEYKGPYEWPNELEDVYKNADFVWAQELSWKGHNSDWLIPNRIYEASYFGVLSLAVKGTQTADIINQRQLGYIIDKQNLKQLESFILCVDKNELTEKKNYLLNRPVNDFVTSSSETKDLITHIMQC